MANPTPVITPDMTMAEIQAAFGTMLQQKHDPQGSEVSASDTNTRFGAILCNLIEDWLKALTNRTDAFIDGASVSVFDTRESGAENTGSIASGDDGDFEIELPSERVTVQWLRVTALSGESGPGGRVRLYADSDRTKLIYDSDMKMGDPAVDVDDFVDGLTWGAFADDGSGLELDGDQPKMYGTITNGGSSASVFVVRMVALCY